MRTLRKSVVVELEDKVSTDEQTDGDYVVDEKHKTCTLTASGIKKAEAYFKVENLAAAENMTLAHHIDQAIKAYGVMQRDIDYVVKDGQVIIVDEFTGRLMIGRRYNEGLHQAIEAKEGVKIAAESKTLATITFQNYFRMYKKLSGMTGTAKTEATEFTEIYGLNIVTVPTNRPRQRIDVYKRQEVAIGADLCTVDEAHDFLEEVPEKLSFMATSCCPAWSMMAKTAFPDLAKNISMTMTPMVFTARMMKQKDPEARMCFIGPCAAKKLEASRRTVRSDVDFVLTFEELAGIIEAKDVDTSLLEVDEAEALHAASAAGRGFAQSGGVAKAVADKIKEWHPDMDVKIASAQGLAECKKLLMLAKAGKYNGYLLEGMGCPGGCIGGAGTIADPARTAIQLNKYVKEAPFADPEQSPFMSEIHVLKDDPDFEL